MPRYIFDMNILVLQHVTYIVTAANETDAIRNAQNGETDSEEAVRNLGIHERHIVSHVLLNEQLTAAPAPPENKRPPIPKFRHLITSLEKYMKLKACKWPGQCSKVAQALLDAQLVRGRLQRGIWDGLIHPGSLFGGRPATAHTWIVSPSGTIIDPTRWVFEHVAPYVYQGPNDHYDLAAMRMRARHHARPVPAYDPTGDHVPLRLPRDARRHVLMLLEAQHGFTMAQLFWLANCPVEILGEHTRTIYAAIAKTGHIGMVPIDLRREYLPDASATELSRPADRRPRKKR